MRKSKLEKISDYLCAIGEIMCIGAMIGEIIYVILYGVESGLMKVFVIYVVGTLIVASSGMVWQVDISKSKQEEMNKLYVQMGRSEERAEEDDIYATDVCDHSIKKMPQTIDKQVVKDYIKELESEIKEIDRLNSLFSLNLAVQKSLKRIVRELKELIK